MKLSSTFIGLLGKSLRARSAVRPATGVGLLAQDVHSSLREQARPRLGTDDTVGREPLARLERHDCLLCLASEIAIRIERAATRLVQQVLELPYFFSLVRQPQYRQAGGR